MSDEEFKLMFQKNCFTPEHKIGDSVFYIADHNLSDKISPFQLKIKEEKNAIQRIVITDVGFAYGNFDSYEPFADDKGFFNEDTFWTKEDAEQYLKTLEPMVNIFKEGDTVFYKNPSSRKMSEAEVLGFSFYNGTFKYDTDCNFEFEYKDIGKKFFVSKENFVKANFNPDKTNER